MAGGTLRCLVVLALDAISKSYDRFALALIRLAPSRLLLPQIQRVAQQETVDCAWRSFWIWRIFLVASL